MELLMMQMDDRPVYYAGIDLALRAKNVVAVLDERGRRLGRPVAFGRTHDEFQAMFQAVTQRVPQGFGLVWGCEATGAAWRLITACLIREKQAVSLENPAAIAALRDVDSRFFKNDRVDARTIGELVCLRVSRGKPLCPPPSPQLQAMRTLTRRIEGMKNELSSAKTRFTAYLCDTLLPSLSPAAHEWSGPTLLRVLDKFADPRDIASKPLARFINSAIKAGGARTSRVALATLHQAATESLRSYGDTGLDYSTYALILRDTILQVNQLQARIVTLQGQLDSLLDKTRTHSQVECGLSVPGVGDDTLNVLMALCGPPGQWPAFKAIKQFAGTVPVLDESGNSRSTPRMSKLGEPILRKVIFQIGNVARRYDAEFAADYYHQMVSKGKGHTAACISAGLKALNALRAVLRDHRPYQPRDPRTGLPITKQESRQLAQANYSVPGAIRTARKKHKRGTDAPAKHTSKETAQAGHAQVKDMPKHSHRRAVNLPCAVPTVTIDHLSPARKALDDR